MNCHSFHYSDYFLPYSCDHPWLQPFWVHILAPLTPLMPLPICIWKEISGYFSFQFKLPSQPQWEAMGIRVKSRTGSLRELRPEGGESGQPSPRAGFSCALLHLLQRAFSRQSRVIVYKWGGGSLNLVPGSLRLTCRPHLGNPVYCLHALSLSCVQLLLRPHGL